MGDGAKEDVLVLLLQFGGEELLLLGHVHEYDDIHQCVHYLHFLEDEGVGVLAYAELVVGVDGAGEVVAALLLEALVGLLDSAQQLPEGVALLGLPDG